MDKVDRERKVEDELRTGYKEQYEEDTLSKVNIIHSVLVRRVLTMRGCLTPRPAPGSSLPLCRREDCAS